MKLPQLPVDKANHFVYGAVIGFIAVLFLTSLQAMIVVVMIAGVKEIFDKFSKTGTPETFDFIWTFIGGTLTVW